METVYKTDFLDLFHTDCMKIMKQYPDKYFDLAIVDPPYGIGAGNKNFINRNTANKKAEKFYRDNDWDKCRPTKEYFEELKRVSTNYIIWGGNYFVDLLEPARCYIVWDKKTGDNSYADCELALTNIDSNAKVITKFWLGAHATNGMERIHPTEKPIYLYAELIKNYAKTNFKILDTHFGSGSIALAVDRANRLDNMNLHLTACEIDKDYIDAAVKRISWNIKQGTFSF